MSDQISAAETSPASEQPQQPAIEETVVSNTHADSEPTSATTSNAAHQEPDATVQHEAEASTPNEGTTRNPEDTGEAIAAAPVQASSSDGMKAETASEAPSSDAGASAAHSTPAAEPTVAAHQAGVTPTVVGHISTEEFARMQEEERKRREEDRARKEAERKARDEAYAKLEEFKASNTAFDVEVSERVKGGLRCLFEGQRLFLPTSQFSIKRSFQEGDLLAAVGTTLTVKIHEITTDENGQKSVVVSRRDLLQEELWKDIEPGKVYDGVVTSTTPFGVFVNIGGAEGLVHISRLSKTRVATAEEVTKKGATLKVTVLEVDREKKKISLSHKEHEADPWELVPQNFRVGDVVKGTVKRIVDFGAYVQVAARIEGLVRISELSWTRRVKHPSDILAVGQEINVVVLEINAPKHQLALGYKQTIPNPWLQVEQRMPIGTVVKGSVTQVTPQGAVLRVDDDFDGFMPRSKMNNLGPGKKIALNVGDEVECIVADLNPGGPSLILAMIADDGSAYSVATEKQSQAGDRTATRDGRRDRESRQSVSRSDDAQQAPSAGVTIGDLLREADKSKLNG